METVGLLRSLAVFGNSLKLVGPPCQPDLPLHAGVFQQVVHPAVNYFIGFLLALILVNIINKRSFGWTIPLTLQWETFLQALAVAVASALLASIYPMVRMNRLQIASALRQE